jgi:hypothetical protein
MDQSQLVIGRYYFLTSPQSGLIGSVLRVECVGPGAYTTVIWCDHPTEIGVQWGLVKGDTFEELSEEEIAIYKLA